MQSNKKQNARVPILDTYVVESDYNGPTPHPMITDPPTTDSAASSLPEHIFNNLNKQALQRRLGIMWRFSARISRTIQQRKEDLFDDMNPFVLIANHLSGFPKLSTHQQPARTPPTQGLIATVHDGHHCTTSSEEGSRHDKDERKPGHVRPQTLNAKLNALISFLKGIIWYQAYWALRQRNVLVEASKSATPVLLLLEKDICSIVLTSDIIVPPSSNCLCEDLRSACDREHTKVLELEAEISKQKQLITESEKRSKIVSIVGTICDGGLEVAFRQHSCHIRIYDMVDLLKGSRTTNLYSISLNDMMSASPVCLLTKASSTNHLMASSLNQSEFRT
ncbi:hypothetical protein Tco_0907034 [Tanacetum coccineum]|uniref:Uncharacterized protein n=1 Tax=Tanacetum coccineum TaxID=301880 RepID=A0ABQ5CPG2_9ASTR